MVISCCSSWCGSVSFLFCCNIEKKEAYYEVIVHIVGEKYEKIAFADFAEAVDAYNAGAKELKIWSHFNANSKVKCIK